VIQFSAAARDFPSEPPIHWASEVNWAGPEPDRFAEVKNERICTSPLCLRGVCKELFPSIIKLCMKMVDRARC
jgi:hypothetical protein